MRVAPQPPTPHDRRYSATWYHWDGRTTEADIIERAATDARHTHTAVQVVLNGRDTIIVHPDGHTDTAPETP